MSEATSYSVGSRAGCLLLCLLLSACQPYSGRANMVENLPQPEQLTCCWQKLESIRVRGLGNEGKPVQLLAVIVREKDSLLVNLLSAEGQQWLSMKQDDTGYRVTHFVEELKKIPEYLVLYGIYLTYADPASWSEKGGLWNVTKEPMARALRYRDRHFMNVIDRSSDNTWAERSVELARGKMSFDISTLENRSLPQSLDQ